MPPPRNKALLTVYQPPEFINHHYPLVIPYFLVGGGIGGVP